MKKIGFTRICRKISRIRITRFLRKVKRFFCATRKVTLFICTVLLFDQHFFLAKKFFFQNFHIRQIRHEDFCSDSVCSSVRSSSRSGYPPWVLKRAVLESFFEIFWFSWLFLNFLEFFGLFMVFICIFCVFCLYLFCIFL